MFQKYKTPTFLFIIITCSFLLALPDVKYNQYLTDEDSWIENISAIAFLVAAILFFICFWHSKGKGNRFWRWTTNRNIFYLLIGLLFFVAFGEEISWGQRIFGWATPEALAEINYQQETNIHNLDFFTFKDEAGDKWWSFLLVLNAGRLFFYFWFSFMVLMPLAYRWSKYFQRLFDQINIPIAPLWTGLLMIATLVLSKVYKIILGADQYSESIDEIMEGNYALLIAVLAIQFYKETQPNSAVQMMQG